MHPVRQLPAVLRGLIVFVLAVLLAGCTSGEVETPGAASESTSTLGVDAPVRAQQVDWLVNSPAVGGRSMHQFALVPEGAGQTGRPLLVMLHGFGDGSRSWVADPMPKILHELGEDAPIVVAPDGGVDSWWLNRASGDWERYLVDEVIPDAVERFGADPERVAISGYSMGGAGAFTIAMHHPGRFCVVGGHDAAIARSFDSSVRTQFDSERHYRANDLLSYAARPDAFPGAELSLDRGTGDAFMAGQDAFVDVLRASGVSIEYRVEPGIHTMRSVRQNLEPAIADYAHALATCQQPDGARRSAR